MKRGERVVEIATVFLVGLGGVLAGGGFSEHQDGPRRTLFFFSYACFVLAVLIPLAYFGIHPLFVTLNTWRAGVLVGLRERMAEHRARAAALDSRTGAATPRAGDLVVDKATYRPADHSGTGTDVTGILTGMAVNGQVDMTASNDELGGDPAPGKPKELAIDWRRDGGPPHTTIVNEGNSFTL